MPRQAAEDQSVLPAPPAFPFRRQSPDSPPRGDLSVLPDHQASSLEGDETDSELDTRDPSGSDGAEGERPLPADSELDSDGEDDTDEPYKPHDMDNEMDEEPEQVEQDELDEEVMELLADGEEAKRARSYCTDESDKEGKRRKKRKKGGKKSSAVHESRLVRLPKNGILAPRSPLAVFSN
ncbi:hypothetical protein JCM10296v2_001912 [Rhodotorula toruloides]